MLPHKVLMINFKLCCNDCEYESFCCFLKNNSDSEAIRLVKSGPTNSFKGYANHLCVRVSVMAFNSLSNTYT